MNAELGRNYSTGKHLNWIFASTSDARPGWGCANGRWGSYDAYGLMGSTTDSSGYAFSMNTYAAAGLIAPVVRYEPQYARLLGRWLLHRRRQRQPLLSRTLSHEHAVQRRLGATNRRAEHLLRRRPPSRRHDALRHRRCHRADSGSESLRRLGERLHGRVCSKRPTCRAFSRSTASPPKRFRQPTCPTVLFYNPYAVAKQVTVSVGPNAKHLYDSVTGAFLATNVTGTATLTLSRQILRSSWCCARQRTPSVSIRPEAAGGRRCH